MTRTTNRVISAILTLALIIGLFSLTPTNVNATSIGESTDLKSGADLSGSQVYFGKNGNTPIMWYVVATDSAMNTATLFSSSRVRSAAYDFSNGYSSTHQHWKDSDICKWLNSDSGGWTTGGESGYDSTDTQGFLKRSFSTSENTSITTYGSIDTSVNDNPVYIPQIDINQKIVLPSYEEVKNGGTWGFTGNATRAAVDGYWWLRSPYGDFDGSAYFVYGGDPASGSLVYNMLSVFPALKLNLNSVLFTSDANKVSKTDVGDISLEKISDTPTSVALTLTDSSLSLETTATSVSAATGGSVKIPYTGVTTGTGKSVSVMICDKNDEMLYYGRPVNLPSGTPISGTATVKIPSDLSVGEDYTIKIFNEQVNTEYLTDYASQPEEIVLNVIDRVAPTITNTTTSTSIEAGKSDTIKVAATGEPTPTFSAVSMGGADLPDWISIDEDTGEITATPPATQTAGDYYITVTASNGVSPDASTNFKITVTEVPPITTPPTITNTTNTSLSVETGKTGTLSVIATGSPTPTYSALLSNGDPLPSWISINETTGVITISPTAGQSAGDTVITVTASNGIGAPATKNFTITVTKPDTPPAVTNYTVTLNVNGGKALSNNKLTVTQGKTYGKLPTPKRTGYKFKGWYTAKSGGTKIISTSTVNLKGNQTLYAQWTANKYKVTFVGNKGKIKKSGKYKARTLSLNKTYGKKYSTLPKAKRTGYKFKGWYTKKTGGKKVTKNTVVTSAKNIKLYARWTANARIVNCKWVHMRKAPGVNKTTKKYIKRGTKAAILGKVKVSGKYTWYKVRVGNKVGYIYSKYVKRV